MRAVAEIAGMGVFDDEFDEFAATELIRQCPGAGLIDVHQRRFDGDVFIESERQRLG